MPASLTSIFMRYLATLFACLAIMVYAGYALLTDAGYTDRFAPLAGGGWIAGLWDGVRAVLTPRLVYLAALVAAAIVILIGTARLHRRTVRAVLHDIKSLGRLFRDVREGAVRVDYPMELSEFADVFRYLRHSGTRMVEEKKKFTRMGLVDHLSQLNNRRHFERRLAELFEHLHASGPSSLLIIDVDHFKEVNDRHGHDAGDALIVGFSRALVEHVRKTDFLARLGGDEFCVIYPYTDLATARVLAERLRAELPERLPLPRGVQHSVRWTGGLSVMTDADRKFDAVLWRADQALLAAKEAGRNNTQVYAEGDNPPRHRNVRAV
jgi:diguanylate cyclase (GGDEF)-like protein